MNAEFETHSTPWEKVAERTRTMTIRATTAYYNTFNAIRQANKLCKVIATMSKRFVMSTIRNKTWHMFKVARRWLLKLRTNRKPEQFRPSRSTLYKTEDQHAHDVTLLSYTFRVLMHAFKLQAGQIIRKECNQAPGTKWLSCSSLRDRPTLSVPKACTR